MGLEKYIKLTTAAKLCGLDKRTLLARLMAKGFVVPANKHGRPMLVRESDVEQVMRDYAIQPREAGTNQPEEEV